VTRHPCIACGAERWTPRYRELVTCDACGFVRAADLPSAAELARLYGPAYFEGEEYADYLGDRDVHRLNFQRRMRRITAAAGRLESMFEIGCAYGLWLQVAAGHGIRVAGSDISLEAVCYAREQLKLDARPGAFADAGVRPGEFQSFCLWDTLEHLAEPEAIVEEIARVLPPGGWFFATTGDIGSRTAQRQADRWRMIHPPTHLQYFSRATIEAFLARHRLRITQLESEPMCRSLNGALGGLRQFGRGPARAAAGLASAVLPAAVTRRLRFTLDLGDIMLVCARRE
jgi:SAM-dependent methyltransferase